MELSPTQQDALIELLNIGFGRAGAALSQLTGHRVVLEVPEVSIHPIAALAPALRGVASDDVASVHQIFSGPVAGDALLILDHGAAGAWARSATCCRCRCRSRCRGSISRRSTPSSSR
jgi:chemotaxis protein CheC